MTKEEAILVLQNDAYILYEDDSPYDRQAYDMAIKALKEQKHGEWMPIIEANEFGEAYQCGCYCSECGEELQSEPNYCPNCGADMRQKDGE